jgi:hypothetical protein
MIHPTKSKERRLRQKRKNMIEFRDLAGNFILGWILGKDRVVVLRSKKSDTGGQG